MILPCSVYTLICCCVVECFHISEGLDLLHSEVLHYIIVVVHHHSQWLTWTQNRKSWLKLSGCFIPNIREIHTNTFPNLGPRLLSTNTDTGNSGAWTNMPRNPQTLKSLSGIEIKYSWKNADVANTTSVAVVLEFPAETRGLYKCRTHHLAIGQQLRNHLVCLPLPVHGQIPEFPEFSQIARIPPVVVEVPVGKL